MGWGGRPCLVRSMAYAEGKSFVVVILCLLRCTETSVCLREVRMFVVIHRCLKVLFVSPFLYRRVAFYAKYFYANFCLRCQHRFPLDH